jgi:hypothetical protein
MVHGTSNRYVLPVSRFESLKIMLTALAISIAIFAAFALIGYAAGLRY